MRIICLIFSMLLILCCCSCTFIFDIPDTVTIEGKEYKIAFTDVLYPIYGVVSDKGVKIFGSNYYRYSETPYDCYISYSHNAKPKVYFEASCFNEAISYYKDASNFNYFCILGNIHDESKRQMIELQEIDALMLDRLIEFADENEYAPFSFSSKENELKKVPIADASHWTAGEIHFFKESKDDAFSTSRGYTFVMLDERLCLLYQYDFSDENVPCMTVCEMPTDISDYFFTLTKELRQLS